MPREADLCLMSGQTFSVYPRAVEALRCGRAFRQVPLRLLEASARSINLRLRDLGMSTPLQNAKVQSHSKLAETAFFDWLAQRTWGEPTDGDLLSFTLNQSRAA